MNANFKYLIYCFIALLAFSCKEDAVGPVEDLAYYKYEAVAFAKPVVDRDAVYSPDGSIIAFCRNPKLYELKDQEGLYIMDKTGNNLRFLFSGICFSPKFSPDGKKLAFTRDYRLTILDFEKGTFKEVSDKYAGNVFLDWSPDGKRIVFEMFDEATNGALVLGTIDTSLNENSFKQITKSLTGDARNPAYFNDSKTVYFYKASGEDNSYFKSLQKVDLNSEMTSIVNDDSYDSFFLNLSKDGSKVVHNIGDYNIIIRGIAGNLKERINFRGHMPTFHPNGKSLLFSSPDSAGVGVRLATYDFETKSIKFIKYY
jgi:Tol biopolymer transport system component